MVDCPHSKLYSGERLCTLAGLWQWVCRDCGAIGQDTGTAPDTCPGPIDLVEFYEVSRRWGHDVEYLRAIVAQRRFWSAVDPFGPGGDFP
jgi:hypothetical protein